MATGALAGGRGGQRRRNGTWQRREPAFSVVAGILCGRAAPCSRSRSRGFGESLSAPPVPAEILVGRRDSAAATDAAPADAAGVPPMPCALRHRLWAALTWNPDVDVSSQMLTDSDPLTTRCRTTSPMRSHPRCPSRARGVGRQARCRRRSPAWADRGPIADASPRRALRASPTASGERARAPRETSWKSTRSAADSGSRASSGVAPGGYGGRLAAPCGAESRRYTGRRLATTPAV